MNRFQPGWKMTAFTLVLLPLVISLGSWQLSRGALKRSMEMEYLIALTALPVSVDEMDVDQQFQRVKLIGEFGDEIFLVDNQIHQGRAGYWVIQVFNTTAGRRLLTNRGFVVAPIRREDLPELDVPVGTIELIGTIWPYTGLVPVLDENLWSEGWPKRVQRLDVARMAQTAGTEAVEMRLEPGQPGVTQAAPFAAVLSDAKHLGYAATWFGLAAVLCIGFVVFGLKNARVASRPQATDRRQTDRLEDTKND